MGVTACGIQTGSGTHVSEATVSETGTDMSKETGSQTSNANTSGAKESMPQISTTDASIPKESTPPKNEKTINEDQALTAIQNYCCSNNSELEQYRNAKEGPVYWAVSSDENNQIVIVFRSYTGSINHYYIDAVTGDTYVTEMVPGITDGEQKTEEHFNVKDYL
jgi:hypothetical protein